MRPSVAQSRRQTESGVCGHASVPRHRSVWRIDTRARGLLEGVDPRRPNGPVYPRLVRVIFHKAHAGVVPGGVDGRGFASSRVEAAEVDAAWRGIGVFVNDNPGYHTLFGSVSISREYTDLARALIADTLLTNYQADSFQHLVQPITPHKVRNRVWSVEMLQALANIKILSKLVGRCDPGKAVPVLLRHYLSLKGRLVCFNVHPHFNNSLEGLIIVDMRLCDSKTAIRFMGEAGYNRFLELHRLKKSA